MSGGTWVAMGAGQGQVPGLPWLAARRPAKPLRVTRPLPAAVAASLDAGPTVTGSALPRALAAALAELLRRHAAESPVPLLVQGRDSRVMPLFVAVDADMTLTGAASAVGDAESAATQALVGREERAHVRFAVEWFRKWTGGLSFDEWSRSLPEPLSPLFMRGKPFEVRAREASGMDATFLEALAAWQPRGF